MSDPSHLQGAPLTLPPAPARRQLSEFITRGCVEPPAPAPPAGPATKGAPSVARRDSQDTLDDVDEGVYDTITEPPGPLPTAATSAV